VIGVPSASVEGGLPSHDPAKNAILLKTQG